MGLHSDIPQTRRDFLITTAAFAGGVGAGLLPRAPGAHAGPEPVGGGQRPLKVLFLGGTGFLGPHTVRGLVERGHEVTLFNRGNRDHLFPDLELIRGNRIIDIKPGLEPLRKEIDAGRTWDVVIDTANVHTWVEHSAALLAPAAGSYLFVSTMSVYKDNATKGQDESAELHTMPDDIADGITKLPYDMNFYGAVKARCEAAARKHFPNTTAVVRPGLIVGPGDSTLRFTYWPLRIRDGGEVLAPGDPDTQVLFIDARDLAAFMVTIIEKKLASVYNVAGPIHHGNPDNTRPEQGTTMGAMLNAIRDALGSEATFTWAEAGFLAAHGVGPWMDMPVWIPDNAQMGGFHTRSIARAQRAGLTTRPVGETAVDTLAWFDDRFVPAMKERNAGYQYTPGQSTPGITREREAELLGLLRARDQNTED